MWPVETASAASFRSFDATVLETWRSRLKEEEKYLMRVEAVKATVVSEAGSVVWGGEATREAHHCAAGCEHSPGGSRRDNTLSY